MLGDNAYNVGSDTNTRAQCSTCIPRCCASRCSFHRWAITKPRKPGYVDTYPYFSIFTLPTAGEGGGVPSGTEHFYSSTSATFICLPGFDDWRSRHKRDHGELATRRPCRYAKTWIVAFFHHRLTQRVAQLDSENELIQMRQNFNPILESYGVDLC
jgi:hypothetical protein